MLFYIIKKEFQNNIISLRFQIAFFLVLLLFCIGTFAFINNYKNDSNEYREYKQGYLAASKKTAESNLTRFITEKRNEILESRSSGFITDSKEKLIPNIFTNSGYNVFSFKVRNGSTNPYLNKFLELNWVFIVSIIFSFVVFLFTFDAISGEKESKTLALLLSNTISRSELLLGKYISTVITTIFLFIVGICLSLIIILISTEIKITGAMIGEIFAYLFTVILFVASITSFGMLSSVITHNSNVSLLCALTFWLAFVVIVPNSAIFWAQKLFPIENRESIEKKVYQSDVDINRSVSQDAWGASSSDPFLPQHRLRADYKTRLMNSEMQIRNAHYQKMFHQFSRTRIVTFLSPVSLFEYVCEAIVGGGYLRFQKAWENLHAYQTQLLTFFKAKDAADPASPHWYNPYEDYSTTRKPVKFEEVPLFQEKIISFGERFSFASIYIVVMVLYTALVFFLTYVLFVKYDVR